MTGGLDYRLDTRAKSLWTGLDNCSLLILQCPQCSRNERQQRCCENGERLVETGLGKEQKLPLCFLRQWLCGSLKFISAAPGSLSSLKLKNLFMPLRDKRFCLWNYDQPFGRRNSTFSAEVCKPITPPCLQIPAGLKSLLWLDQKFQSSTDFKSNKRKRIFSNSKSGFNCKCEREGLRYTLVRHMKWRFSSPFSTVYQRSISARFSLNRSSFVHLCGSPGRRITQLGALLTVLC